MECPQWEWAEVDNNRLVWAENGKLFSGQVDTSGVINQKELYDFNEMKYKEIKAPY